MILVSVDKGVCHCLQGVMWVLDKYLRSKGKLQTLFHLQGDLFLSFCHLLLFLVS